jgi:hypothetical protein
LGAGASTGGCCGAVCAHAAAPASEPINTTAAVIRALCIALSRFFHIVGTRGAEDIEIIIQSE